MRKGGREGGREGGRGKARGEREEGKVGFIRFTRHSHPHSSASIISASLLKAMGCNIIFPGGLHCNYRHSSTIFTENLSATF